MSVQARVALPIGYADPASGNWVSSQFHEAVALFHEGANRAAIEIILSLLTSKTEGEPEHFELLRLRALCRLTDGDLSGAQFEAERIQDLSTQFKKPIWEGHALLVLAAVNREKGHATYGTDLATRAKMLLQSASDLTGFARACYEVGYGMLLQGRLGEAQQELEAASALARATADAMTEAMATRRLAFCHVQQNEFAHARSAYGRSLKLFGELGSKWRAAQAIYGLAVLEISLGNLDQAREGITAWDEYCEQSTNPVRLGRWRLLKAWLDVCSGQPSNAVVALERLKSEFQSLGAQRDVALCSEYLGDAFGLLGNDELALEAYREAADWGRRVSVAADVVCESLRKAGEAYARTGQHTNGLLAARRASLLSKTYTEPIERAALLRLRGILKLQRGRARVGAELLEKSWTMFFRIGSVVEAAATAVVLSHYFEQVGKQVEAANWSRRTGGLRPPSVGLLLPRARASTTNRLIRALAEDLSRQAASFGIITSDARFLKAFELVLRTAPLDLPILILGETGTGKELFANLAHAKSGRKGSLLAINCAALPADILDAELFGHAKGAYTGAYRDRPGLIEAANDGTLFLDEIGEMTLAVQGRLLRAIEAKEVRRLGENHARSVSTRFVGATHRDLNQMVKEGSFRADLFFRLKGVIVKLPPLRERPGDILLLAEHFLAQTALRAGRRFELGRDAKERLGAHSWPGNVRELRSVIERAAAMCMPGVPITAEDLDIEWSPIGGSLEEHLESEERRKLLAVLESVDWNQSKAARQLKMRRTTLVGKLARLGIERPSKKKQ